MKYYILSIVYHDANNNLYTDIGKIYTNLKDAINSGIKILDEYISWYIDEIGESKRFYKYDIGSIGSRQEIEYEFKISMINSEIYEHHQKQIVRETFNNTGSLLESIITISGIVANFSKDGMYACCNVVNTGSTVDIWFDKDFNELPAFQYSYKAGDIIGYKGGIYTIQEPVCQNIDEFLDNDMEFYRCYPAEGIDYNYRYTWITHPCNVNDRTIEPINDNMKSMVTFMETKFPSILVNSMLPDNTIDEKFVQKEIYKYLSNV